MACIFATLEPGNLSQRVALAYLCASGIGTVSLFDNAGPISEEEAHQGFAFAPTDAGLNRAQIFATYLRSLNPEITVDLRPSAQAGDSVLPSLDNAQSLAKTK